MQTISRNEMEHKICGYNQMNCNFAKFSTTMDLNINYSTFDHLRISSSRSRWTEFVTDKSES